MILANFYKIEFTGFVQTLKLHVKTSKLIISPKNIFQSISLILLNRYINNEIYGRFFFSISINRCFKSLKFFHEVSPLQFNLINNSQSRCSNTVQIFLIWILIASSAAVENLGRYDRMWHENGKRILGPGNRRANEYIGWYYWCVTTYWIHNTIIEVFIFHEKYIKSGGSNGSRKQNVVFGTFGYILHLTSSKRHNSDTLSSQEYP